MTLFNNPDPKTNHLFADSCTALKMILEGKFQSRYEILKDHTIEDIVDKMRIHSAGMFVLGLALGIVTSVLCILIYLFYEAVI